VRDTAGCLIGGVLCACARRNAVWARAAGALRACGVQADSAFGPCGRVGEPERELERERGGDSDRFGRDSSAVLCGTWRDSLEVATLRALVGPAPLPVGGFGRCDTHTVHRAPYYAGRLNLVRLAKPFFLARGARGIWLKALKCSVFFFFFSRKWNKSMLTWSNEHLPNFSCIY